MREIHNATLMSHYVVFANIEKQGFLRQNIYMRQKRKRYYTNTMLAGFNFTIQYTREGLYIHIDLITSKL